MILAFKNAPKPLKIHWISVAKRPKQGQCKCSHVWLKAWRNKACKEGDDSKKNGTLNKPEEQVKKRFFFSLARGPKQLTNKANMSCKNSPKREIKDKGAADGLEQERALQHS